MTITVLLTIMGIFCAGMATVGWTIGAASSYSRDKHGILAGLFMGHSCAAVSGICFLILYHRM